MLFGTFSIQANNRFTRKKEMTMADSRNYYFSSLLTCCLFQVPDHPAYPAEPDEDKIFSAVLP